MISVMNESAFKGILQQGIITHIEVAEALPSKGKPAQKELGSTTVWIVKIHLGGKELILESTRGGPREWASLDSLDKWLKGHGVINYSINHGSNSDALLQQSLI